LQGTMLVSAQDIGDPVPMLAPSNADNALVTCGDLPDLPHKKSVVNQQSWGLKWNLFMFRNPPF
jgi:hypothetical protein